VRFRRGDPSRRKKEVGRIEEEGEDEDEERRQQERRGVSA